MAKAKFAQARVLVDNPSLGILCNQIVEGPGDVIAAMAAAGAVDPHPDAVAYAAGQGARVVTLDDPAGAAEFAAAAAESQAAEGDAAETTFE